MRPATTDWGATVVWATGLARTHGRPDRATMACVKEPTFDQSGVTTGRSKCGLLKPRVKPSGGGVNSAGAI